MIHQLNEVKRNLKCFEERAFGKAPISLDVRLASLEQDRSRIKWYGWIVGTALTALGIGGYGSVVAIARDAAATRARTVATDAATEAAMKVVENDSDLATLRGAARSASDAASDYATLARKKLDDAALSASSLSELQGRLKQLERSGRVLSRSESVLNTPETFKKVDGGWWMAKVSVPFTPAFVKAPMVLLSVSAVEFDKHESLPFSYWLRPEAVTINGFDIVLLVGNKPPSTLSGIRVVWVAIEPYASEGGQDVP